MLFKELDGRFQKIWYAMTDNSHEVSYDSCGNVQGLGLLLRCCLTLLILLGFDQKLITVKTKTLLLILERLFSFDLSRQNKEKTIKFKKLHQQYCRTEGGETTAIDEDFVASLHFVEPSDPRHSLITTLLEVIMESHDNCFRLVLLEFSNLFRKSCFI